MFCGGCSGHMRSRRSGRSQGKEREVSSFVPAKRMREIDLDRRILGAPALAVEVVSPTDAAEDLHRKLSSTSPPEREPCGFSIPGRERFTFFAPAVSRCCAGRTQCWKIRRSF